jgi:hypothetical protein
MRKAAAVLCLLVLGGCGPDADVLMAQCQLEAAYVADAAGADEVARHRNRVIEHCMRSVGYVWDADAPAECGTFGEFRDGAPLSEDPVSAAACFRSPSTPSRLMDYVSERLN